MPEIDHHPDFVPRNRLGLWIYRLDRELVVQTDLTDRPFKARWLRVDREGTITIPAGYAWDGCTPKLSFFDLFVIGTPDGIIQVKTGLPRTGRGSLVHDALYQYMAWHEFSRAEVDRLFLDLMRRDDFLLSRAYWLAVRLFGGLFAPRKRADRATVRSSMMANAA